MLLVTGVRQSESKRRTKHVQQIQRNGATVWVAPIWDWADKDKAFFMEEAGLPRNPVVDQLCMSGECRCGSFANPLERKEQELLFPDDFADIQRWEKLAQDAGFPWGWGEGGPPDWWQKQQQGQLSFGDNFMGQQMLCWSCNVRQEV